MMRLNALLLLTLCGLFATAGVAHAVPVEYVYGPGGRLAGQFENGVAIGYDYDPAGNITRRYVCQGACFVDGACWDEGQADPVNACQACNGGAAHVAWTSQVGLACDDGNAATTGDMCNAGGVCVGETPPPPDEGGGGGCCRVHGEKAPPTGTVMLVMLVLFMWRIGGRRRR